MTEAQVTPGPNQQQMLAVLEVVVEDAVTELLSGYTDHDSYVSAAALEYLAGAIRRARGHQ